MLQVLIKASERCGLKINKEKSVILIYNSDEMDETKEIEGIPVAEETKYLGVKIINKKDIFRDQRKNILKKAQRMANVTNGVISKCCNKVMIGKTFWKNLALPGILYGANIMTLTDTEVTKLQIIENGVYPWSLKKVSSSEAHRRPRANPRLPSSGLVSGPYYC